MPDFIPAPDAAFDTWQANFMTVVGGSPTDYGLVAGDLVPATALQATWAAAYPDLITAQAAAQAARQTKAGTLLDFAREIPPSVTDQPASSCGPRM